MQNLLLISLDTVRADVAYSKKFPTINKLRSEGVTFLNTVSSSPLTPCSHTTVFTGLQPYNHGVRHLFRERLPKNIPTFTQALKQKGYKTKAIVSCPGMNKWYGFSKGFNSYDDEIPRLADGSDPLKTVDVKKRGTALKRAKLVSEKAIEWLENNKKENFFLFIHFFDAHWPYEAPEKIMGDNPYEEEVGYMDHYLGKVIEYLKKNNLFDNTTIIAFSDHGEDLDGWYPNDKGGSRLGHPEEMGHGCLLYQQTQKVLLIIKDKNLPSNKNIKNQVRLVDVNPTIHDLMSLKQKQKKLDGVSILPIIKGSSLNLIGYSETLYPEELAKNDPKFKKIKTKKSIIYNQTKLISDISGNNTEVYDLNKDPNETNNLFK